MPELTKVFTIATGWHDDEDGPLNLIFVDLENPKSVYTQQVQQQILEDPLFKQLHFPGTILVSGIRDTGCDSLIATIDYRRYIAEHLSTATPGEYLALASTEGFQSYLNLSEEYDRCTLPHKILLGCPDCCELPEPPSRECVIRKLYQIDPSLNDAVGKTTENAKELLRSKHDSIAGFTYISPSLTRVDDFTRTYRTVDEHDFTRIEELSDRISQGLRERGRIRKFKKEECSKCLVRDECVQGKRWCPGAYDFKDDTAAARDVLSKHPPIPYTDKQLLYLLMYSGRLEKRFDRKNYWATFAEARQYYDSGRLAFGICRETTGVFEKLDWPFKKLKEFLIEYADAPEEMPENLPRVTPVVKALLHELSQIHYSPTRVTRWHTTSYSSLAITYSPYTQALTRHFKFNTYRYRWLLPWSITARKFGDVFGETQCLHTLHRAESPLSKRKYFE